MEKNLSQTAYQEACKLIPGGVNSPVRSLRSVGAEPLFIQKASGTILTDIDNQHYIDYCLSWGVHLHGHAHPAITKASIATLRKSSSFGISSPLEAQLAGLVIQSVPSIEKIRFVSSGTEAVMSSIRLARAWTGRDLILKFDGCYHGHADHLLVNAGSGVAGIKSASSAGVPEDFVRHTLSIPFNEIKTVRKVFDKKGYSIAAVIIEPLPANMGVIPPEAGFLEELRELCTRHGSLLIFDEVISGFRLGPGGAQEWYIVRPDITALGKIVGGGYPAAAFGGKTEIMDQLAPLGAVYQAGTLSGNPVAMAAGYESLQLALKEGFYNRLNERSRQFGNELRKLIQGKDIQLNQVGSLFTFFFSSTPVKNFNHASNTNTLQFGRFYRAMLEQGIYLSPSPFEASFLSAAHTDRQLNKTLRAIHKSIKTI